MKEANVTAGPRQLWFDNPWIMAAISFLACVLSFGFEQLCRFTLEPLRAAHVGMALFSGLLIGGMSFFILVGPCQLLIVFLGKWRQVRDRTITVMMLIPAGFVVLSFLHFALSWRNPASEIKRFEVITGEPWPAGAKMLLAEHGWGFQDKRHLWLFEGTPEQFDKLVRDRGWVLSEKSLPETGPRLPVEKAIHCFSRNESWSAHESYFWMADKDAEKGPFGPGHLITDKEHRRWCVWWDAI